MKNDSLKFPFSSLLLQVENTIGTIVAYKFSELNISFSRSRFDSCKEETRIGLGHFLWFIHPISQAPIFLSFCTNYSLSLLSLFLPVYPAGVIVEMDGIYEHDANRPREHFRLFLTFPYFLEPKRVFLRGPCRRWVPLKPLNRLPILWVCSCQILTWL